MKGWFDLFRENGGPTLYAYPNRTPVIGDITTITLVTVFATLYLAFFIVFPGIRKERFTTFLSVTLSLFVGTAILIGTNASGWHHAEAEISSAYKAFSNEKILGRLGIYIGLAHVNVTLEAMPVYYNNSMDVNFNERFHWDGPTQLNDEYRAALIKGLPFPILTVVEYLAVDSEGFCWGRNYREAGYYTSIFLWSSFVLWVCMNLLLVIVPRYGAYLMMATGVMMLFSNFIYYWLLPMKPLHIHIEGVMLTFELGWSFWLIIVAGCLCLLIGIAISVLDLIYPHKFSTILEMDYGTPFDRHTIIEDSTETKKKKKDAPRLEEPATVGFGGLLRRLSKRDHGSNHVGSDNYAFEMEAPKSPWRYPNLMFRNDSRKTHKSVSFKQSTAAAAAASGNRLELPFHHHHLHNAVRREDSSDSSISGAGVQELRTLSVPPFQDPFRKFRRTDSNESNNSSLTSFGGISAILGRHNSRKKVAAAAVKQQQQQQQQQTHLQVERTDSGQSVISRGYVVQEEGRAVAAAAPVVAQPGTSSSSSVKSSVDVGPTIVTVGPLASSSGGVTVTTGGGNHSGNNDDVEVAVIVGGRKNSTTQAVRRNSAEHQRSEASMW